jgi:hypothetical protein
MTARPPQAQALFEHWRDDDPLADFRLGGDDHPVGLDQDYRLRLDLLADVADLGFTPAARSVLADLAVIQGYPADGTAAAAHQDRYDAVTVHLGTNLSVPDWRWVHAEATLRFSRHRWTLATLGFRLLGIDPEADLTWRYERWDGTGSRPDEWESPARRWRPARRVLRDLAAGDTALADRIVADLVDTYGGEAR